MRNHIERVTSEFPALDPELIERIYEQLVVALLRQPTDDELRARVVTLTTSMDKPRLRGFLGLPPRTSAGADGQPRAPVVATGDGARAVRRSGRPGWTAELFWARYRQACERVEPPHSFRAVAAYFDTLDGHRGIDPDHLRKLARRFGLPPG